MTEFSKPLEAGTERYCILHSAGQNGLGWVHPKLFYPVLYSLSKISALAHFPVDTYVDFSDNGIALQSTCSRLFMMSGMLSIPGTSSRPVL